MTASFRSSSYLQFANIGTSTSLRWSAEKIHKINSPENAWQDAVSNWISRARNSSSRRLQLANVRREIALRFAPNSLTAPQPIAMQVELGSGLFLHMGPSRSGPGRQTGRTHRLKRRGSSSMIIAMSFLMLLGLYCGCSIVYRALLNCDIGENEFCRSTPAWISKYWPAYLRVQTHDRVRVFELLKLFFFFFF